MRPNDEIAEEEQQRPWYYNAAGWAVSAVFPTVTIVGLVIRLSGGA